MQINLIGPCQYQTSYGETVISMVTALVELGHEVSLFPIGERVSLDPGCTWTHKPISDAIQRGKYSYQTYAPCVRLYHQFSQSEFVGTGPRYAFPIFELDKFTRLEKAQLSRVDYILTTSGWGRDVVMKELQDDLSNKTFCIPLGVDSCIFNESPIQSGSTRFLVIGKTEVRKRSREIVQAFHSAFQPSDNVELYLCWHNIFNTPEEQEEWNRFAKSGPLSSKVNIVPRLNSSMEVASLIKHCDCVVSMSSAEGWNYGNLQGMACGRHVITTNNSAQSEFCNDANSDIITTIETELAFDNKWFLGKDFDGEPGRWAKVGRPQIEQLISHMKNIHMMKQTGKLELNKNGLQTAQDFSWKNSAETLVQWLS